MTDDTPQTPQERLDAARAEFEAIQKVLPPGIQGFQVPPWTELVATADGLVRALIAKGVLNEQEFADEKNTRWAELMEDLVAQGREVKRQFSGLVLPQPGQQL